jgi:hypothetical protein
VRLLIVEDSALIRKVTSLAFPSKEHELVEVEDGQAALAAIDAAAAPFDAILLVSTCLAWTSVSSSAPSGNVPCIATPRWCSPSSTRWVRVLYMSRYSGEELRDRGIEIPIGSFGVPQQPGRSVTAINVSFWTLTYGPSRS